LRVLQCASRPMSVRIFEGQRVQTFHPGQWLQEPAHPLW
jgi:hypothetical protein